jgi:NAD(P)H-hydrate epimerase
VNTIFTVAEMAAADRAAVAAGLSARVLMENAGKSVALAILRRFARRPTLVLCGPGDNGGDGWVLARLLAGWGWPVTVATAQPRHRLRGAASACAAAWTGAVMDLADLSPTAEMLVVDALFGAGLSRPVAGVEAAALRRVAAARVPVVAVDLPSGVAGDGGAILGVAIQAVVTVTFHRLKPGHLLFPGAGLCGVVEVADIGIPAAAMDAIRPRQRVNAPDAWVAALPSPAPERHKYDRGHLAVFVGPTMPGAALLAAKAARRAGAGLVTLVGAAADLADPGMLRRSDSDDGAFWRAGRIDAAVIGPGAGTDRPARSALDAALARGLPVVLDADALTLLAGPDALARMLAGPAVLTPHDGEFRRLFPDIVGDRLARARAAAAVTGAIVLSKGVDSVVAHPDGRATILDRAPSTLATAGSGDVLAGVVGALLAGGMPAFEAASAATWAHARAAEACAGDLIAEDLAEAIGRPLAALRQVTRPG